MFMIMFRCQNKYWTAEMDLCLRRDWLTVSCFYIKISHWFIIRKFIHLNELFTHWCPSREMRGMHPHSPPNISEFWVKKYPLKLENRIKLRKSLELNVPILLIVDRQPCMYLSMVFYQFLQLFGLITSRCASLIREQDSRAGDSRAEDCRAD